MKYKVLIAGKNDPVIDIFFTKMSDLFEVLSTSIRNEDLNGHMKYFEPDIFVLCLYKESQDYISKAAGMKSKLSQMGVPFAVIGMKEDCARFEAGAPKVSDLTLCLPLTTGAVREELVKRIQKSKEAARAGISQPEPSTPVRSESTSAAKPVAPAGSESTSAAKPVAPAGSGSTSAAKPVAPTGSTVSVQAGVRTGSVEVDASQTVKRRELSSSLIREALTSDEAYEEMIYALERRLDFLEGASASTSTSTRRKHVLVVDDDSMMLKLMKEYLHEKYDVATALNGKIALKFLERKQTDLILLDYEMPGENGPAVLEQLRASVDTQNIPVVFITGVTEGKKIQEALALKPQSYLLKPIQQGKLLAAIEKIIG